MDELDSAFWTGACNVGPYYGDAPSSDDPEYIHCGPGMELTEEVLNS